MSATNELRVALQLEMQKKKKKKNSFISYKYVRGIYPHIRTLCHFAIISRPVSGILVATARTG